jgi:hypothetical protein
VVVEDAREEAEEVERVAAVEAARKVRQRERLRGGPRRVDQRRRRDKREVRRCEALEQVAGRVSVDSEGSGRLRISCTGEGVAFMATSAERFLADVGLLDPPSGVPLLDELAVGPALRRAVAG